MPIFELRREVISVPAAHFFILFGYRLFSLYFPLFLLERGFSLVEIGYTYLLIYSTVSIASPFLRIVFEGRDAAKLILLGFAGYLMYSLGMLLSKTAVEIYFWQIFLGVSSATFYISSRFIISESKKSTEEFSYFYLAPYLVSFLAPAIGGAVLILSGFETVFVLSVFIYLFGMFVSKTVIKGTHRIGKPVHEFATLQRVVASYKPVFAVLTLSLLLLGVYRSLFAVFLENLMNRNAVVLFIAAQSFFAALVSFVSRKMASRDDKLDIFLGSFISGITSVIISFSTSLAVIFASFMSQAVGNWLFRTGRSSFLSRKVKKEAAAVFDTFFTSAFVALGALVGGFLSQVFGIRTVFLVFGLLLVFSVLSVRFKYNTAL
ncbi:MAG: MFS transporter [Candidatus Micrarchaeota archaeon]|nr:MFS transporter [Candidatus Micrarchaeota archaeon]